MGAENGSAVQSADRLFGILELLSFHGRGLSLAQICKDTALPKATASRMLSALVTHGYVVQDRENRERRSCPPQWHPYHAGPEWR